MHVEGSYLSGTTVTDRLKRFPVRVSPTHGTGKKTNPSSSDLAPNRGLPSQHLSMLLVRSYRTRAPLPESILDFGF
jgi:hypothetical protein